MPAGDIPNIIEDVNTRPREWRELEHAGTGTPGILKVEWDPIKNDVRVSGPVIQVNPPHAPR